MLGKNHIITNVCSISLLTTCVTVAEKKFDSLITSFDVINEYDIPNIFTYIINFYSIGMDYKIVCFILYIVGSLLPDIDNEKSIIGRYIHLPITHRTWTHSIWVVIILFIISYFYPIMIWLTTGYFLHLFWDSLSRSGICWLYPFSNYITYPNGAKIKKNHYLYLYKSGSSAEYFIIMVLIILLIFIKLY